MTKLFSEFDAVSAKQWKQKIQVDLKGADYNNTLVWTSPEGIAVKPFYNEEDKSSLKSVKTNAAHWKISENIVVTNSKTANKKALISIENGAEAINFTITEATLELNELLQDLDDVQVFLNFTFLSNTLVPKLKALTNQQNLHLTFDILGHFAKEGNWYKNSKADHQLLNEILEVTSTYQTQLSIDVALYQNAGAQIVQQLAYAMAHLNEYLNHYGNKLSQKVCYKVAIGSNYFFEIAKLRALRQLHAILAKNYGLNTNCLIYATPSKRNKTIYDYNTNMLRTTTECMSAILGGAEFITNLSYDALYHHPNDFGERISRNQLLVLKHESYFNAVNNPTDGSYYIESLTEELSKKALAVFKDIENQGGMINQLMHGTIQRKIKESAQMEQDLFNDQEEILLGTNKYPNANDQMKTQIEISPFLEINKRKTLIEPILSKRLAEQIEKERLKNE